MSMDRATKFRVAAAAQQTTASRFAKKMGVTPMHMHCVLHGKRVSPRLENEIDVFIKTGFDKLGIKKIPE
jgi:hypothetical protein